VEGPDSTVEHRKGAITRERQHQMEAQQMCVWKCLHFPPLFPVYLATQMASGDSSYIPGYPSHQLTLPNGLAPLQITIRINGNWIPLMYILLIKVPVYIAKRIGFEYRVRNSDPLWLLQLSKVGECFAPAVFHGLDLEYHPVL